MFTKSEIVDIIELIYFVPALPLAIYVTYKHGIRREAGWLTLIILALVRIIGASTGIAAVQTGSINLYICYYVTSNIGSTLLVASLTGLVNRVYSGTGKIFLPPRITRFLNLISLAAIILSSIGGSDVTSSNTGTQHTGHSLTKVAVILILVQYLATMAIAGFTAMHSRYINTGDRRLFHFALAAAPFVLVRVIYSICSAFDYKSSNFSLLSNTVAAVAIRACMDVAMEILAMTFFLAGGITAPKAQRPASAQAESGTQLQYVKDYQPPNYAPVPQQLD